CVDRSALLGADTREDNIRSFVSERGQQIVEKANPIGRLNLNQRVSRMRLVIDCDSGWEFQFLQPSMLDFVTGLLEQRRKLKRFHLERVPKRVFDRVAIVR